MLENKLSDVSDKSILAFYAGVFKTFGLKEPQWKKTISHHALPALAFIPAEGVRVIMDQEADGKWKSEGKDGTRSEKVYPAGTLFAAIKSEKRSTEKISAKSMFKTVAMQQKPIIVQAVIAGLGINILALATAFFSMQVYDRVIPTEGISTLVALSIGVFIAIFLEMLLKLSRAHILDYASRNMDVAYSHDIFNRFLKIRLDVLPKSIGTLSGQLQSYATVRAFISSAALYMFIDFPFALIFMAVIIMLGGWIMGGIVLVFLLISITVGMFFRKKIEELTKTSSMASHKKLGLLVESVENAENVKATGAGWNILSRWNALTEDAIHDDIEIRHYSEMSTYVAAFFQQFSYISVVATGAYIVSTTGDLTMGGVDSYNNPCRSRTCSRLCFAKSSCAVG
jgi:ATP-binding cassette subfamily C protein LapB